MMRNIFIFISLLLIVTPGCGQRSGLRHFSFKQYTVKLTWREAQSFCRQYHTDLASVKSEEENEEVAGYWGWIGLHRENETTPWKWSREDEAVNFLNWAFGEPNVQNHHCVVKWWKLWYNQDCEDKRFFSCYDEKLVLVKENKTWEEALDHCRSLGGEDSEDPVSGFWKPSYDLATLITDDDHDYARERAQQATTDEVWTGLRFQGNGWFWVGGEPVQYQDIPSCPAFGCGVLEKNSSTSFGIRACSQRRNFFCYRKP